MTTREAAEYLGLAEVSVRQAVRRKKLRATRLDTSSRVLLYAPRDLERYREKHLRGTTRDTQTVKGNGGSVLLHIPPYEE